MGALYLKQMYRFFHNPMEVVSTLFLPVLLLVLFGAGMASALARSSGAAEGFQQAYLSFMAPGAAVLTTLSSAVMGGAVLLQERLHGVLRQYLVAPIPRSAILVGTIGSSVTKAVGQSVLILGLAAAMGAGFHWHGARLVAALAGLVAFALGFAGVAAYFASRASSMAAFHSVITLFNVPLLFASNALYPLKELPAWLQVMAQLNPASYAVDLLRAGLGTGGSELLGPAADVAVLAAFAAAGLAAGVSGARRWAAPV